MIQLNTLRSLGGRRWTVALSALAAGTVALAWSSTADAQIKEPGNHPQYSVELEPHFLLQWEHEPAWGDEGLGLGLRATIPIIEQGPIKKINNSMGIGFGLDWSHFDDSCHWGWERRFGDCSANQFWIPVTWQWNFFLTEVISVFPEAGLGIVHTRWEFPGGQDDSDTDLEGLFFAGVRFHVSDNVGITLRLGWPYISAGASFFL